MGINFYILFLKSKDGEKEKGMCQEVFKIVKNMDLCDVETRLALQCAPVITGIKISNLLIVSGRDEERVSDILKGTGIQHYCLQRQEKKITYLLFRTSELITYLHEERVRNILAKVGYNDFTIIGILSLLQNRYVSYMENKKDFPHELGILLGYPIEDVEGFIKNKGENYLYAGYWKVYQDVEDKKLLFEAYESAKEGLLLLIGNGYRIRPVLEYFQKNGYESIYEKE